MKNKIKSTIAVLIIGALFASCISVKHLPRNKKSSAVTNPPCSFYAGRLNVSWIYVYDQKGLKLPFMQGADSLPKHFTAFKINTQALNSYLKGMSGIPYGKRLISLPVNGGNGCMLFHIEPSGTMSKDLQSKFPNIKSFKGNSDKDPSATLRLDFDGETMRAAMMHGNKIELMMPWKGKRGTLYYLLYYKKDSRNKPISINEHY